MDLEKIIMLLEQDETSEIDLNEIKVLHKLIKLIRHKNKIVRNNAKSLLFKGSYVPTEKIIEEYVSDSNPFLEEVIISKLSFFIPILTDFLMKKDSFKQLHVLLSKQSVQTIQKAVVKSSIIAPILSAIAEIAIRTCHVSYCSNSDSLLTYQIIVENTKRIRKILLFRLNQEDPIFTELVLRTVYQFQDLTKLIVNQIRDIIIDSSVDEHLRYAAIALMNLQDPKNSDILIKRLKTKEDSEEVQLAIIEALGNLGNLSSTDILINQFQKSERIAYHAAHSLALLGEGVYPVLIKALNDDQFVIYVTETMKRLGEKSYDWLIDALAKGKKNVKRNAAQCLTLVISQEHGYEGGIRILTNQLAGKNKEVIQSVTQSLVNLGTPSIRVLIEELSENDMRLRKNAIKILQNFGFQNIELALDGILEVDSNKAVELGVILYIYYPGEDVRKLGLSFAISKNKLRKKNDDLLNIIFRATEEIEPEIRERACLMLSYCGSKSIKFLSQLLSDINLQVRRKAVESLRKVKSKKALIVLIKAAKESDALISETATRALGELQDPGVIDVILNNMKRSNIVVRDASSYAAAKIGMPVVPKLSQQLLSTNHDLVEGSISAISRIGVNAIKPLTKTLEQKSEKWFKNFQKVITAMGQSSVIVLHEIYKKERKDIAKKRILLLLSLLDDTKYMKNYIDIVLNEEAKIGIRMINNVGKSGVISLINNLEQYSKSDINLFIEKSRGMSRELILEMMKEISKNSKLRSFNEKIDKIHGKRVKKLFSNIKDYNKLLDS